MSFINYFFSKKQDKQENNVENIKSNWIIPEKNKNIYVVTNKNSNELIGTFDDLELAKTQGEKATYYDCRIYQFILNQKCRYLSSIVYENK